MKNHPNFIKAHIVILVLEVLSYTLTFLINPGMVMPKVISKETLNLIKNDNNKYCKICKIQKFSKRKIHHCKHCNVCVEGYDHHCPWTGKCIAKRNIIPFYLFLCLAVFLIYYLIIMTILSLYICY